VIISHFELFLLKGRNFIQIYRKNPHLCKIMNVKIFYAIATAITVMLCPALYGMGTPEADSLAAFRQRVSELETKVEMLMQLLPETQAATDTAVASLSKPQNTAATSQATSHISDTQTAAISPMLLISENKSASDTASTSLMLLIPETSPNKWRLEQIRSKGVITRQQMEEFGYGGFVVTDNNTSISIGGLIVGSAYQDFSKMGSTNAFAVSTIANDNKILPRTRFDVSNSRFYINADVKTRKFDYKTRFEFDFNGSGGDYVFHLRHAYVGFWRFQIGYTNSAFVDVSVMPDVMDNGGPSGSLSGTQTQISYNQPVGKNWNVILSIEDGEGHIRAYDMISTSTRIGPDFVVSVRWKQDEESLTQASISSVIHPIDYENPYFSQKTRVGFGINASARWSFTRKDYITANAFFVHGATKYVNDPINAYDAIVNILPDSSDVSFSVQPMYGGYLYYHHEWIPLKLSSNIGYSFIGGVKSFFSVRDYENQLFGHYGSLNLFYYPIEKISLGIEGIAGARINMDGTRGYNLRLMLRALFSF
jgi:hypothetical protein